MNGIETASGPPPDGFHTPVDLRPRRLAPSRIFGAVRRFKVELESPDAVSRQDSPIPGLQRSARQQGVPQGGGAVHPRDALSGPRAQGSSVGLGAVPQVRRMVLIHSRPRFSTPSRCSRMNATLV